MYSMVKGGLVLTLGIFAGVTFAQEGTWRPAGSLASADSAVETASAPRLTKGISLRAPVPLSTRTDTDVAPLTFTPLDPVARGKADAPRPLPSDPQQPAQPVKPIPLEESPPPKTMPGADKIETIPFSPTPVPGSSPALAPVPFSGGGCGCSTSFGGAVGGDCCGCDSCGSCCDSWLGGRRRSRFSCFDTCCTTCCTPCCDVCCDPCCGIDDCCGCCDDCGPRSRVWFTAEYLLWGFREPRMPVLLTTSADGTPSSIAGIYGKDPTIQVLFDQNTFNNPAQSGGRFNIGFWLPRLGDVGVEGSAFFIPTRNQHFEAASGSNGLPILTRPFADATPGATFPNNANIVSHPNLVIPGFQNGFVQPGSFTVDQRTSMYGFDVNLRTKLACGCRWWVDLLYGYRQVGVDDTFIITDRENPPANLGGGIVATDSFATHNTFCGGMIGLAAEVKLLRRWYINGSVKVGIGDMHSVININGQTTFNATNTTAPGGILALQGTNIGNYVKDSFTVVPEFGIKLGCDITDHWRFWVGYTFLAVPNVYRASEQIDPTINRNFLPKNPAFGPFAPPTGPQRPLVPFVTQTFWAQGLSLGLEYHW